MKTVQLRRYTIRDGEFEAFVEWWATSMRALRINAGFTIEFAYGIPETNEFIWAVGVDGSGEDFAEVEARYLDSPERAAVMGAIPERVEERLIQRVTIVSERES
ncbi:MAG: hypothetical protein KF801_02680 [Cryobacterium sp.]|jgi:hypothetical protein|nr:hypothetical protein [Cryobacterium sp.]